MLRLPICITAKRILTDRKVLLLVFILERALREQMEQEEGSYGHFKRDNIDKASFF
ncbi:hypothetical protein I4U23_014797 [Adineta vaga]|nr:hypothetical protein I4U23_014797 [Adineta vaga]